jgi:hypothetical protein
VVEPDVVGERSGQHTRHLGHVRHLAGAQERLGVRDLGAVPQDLAGVLHEPGQRGQQRRLARAHLAQEQHQLASADLEVDVGDADRAVVVHGRQVAQLQALQRLAPGGLGRGRGTCHQVHVALSRHEVGTAGEPRRRHLPGPGAGRLGDDRTRHDAEPGEAHHGARHEQRRGEVPPVGEVERPRSDHAHVQRDQRHGVEHGLHPVLEDRRLHTTRVDLAEMPAHVGGARGQLDRACGVEGRHQRAAEPCTRRRGAGGRAAGDRPADGRGRRRHHHDRQQDGARGPGAADQRRDRDDREAVDEVDPAVRVPHEPVRVHGPGHHLAGRRGGEPVLPGLPVHDRHPDPQQHLDPPARVDTQRARDEQRLHQQQHGEGDQQVHR